MARNTGQGYRRGAVRKRSQTFNTNTSRWTKRNSQTGQFTDMKSDKKPFKGVRKEN